MKFVTGLVLALWATPVWAEGGCTIGKAREFEARARTYVKTFRSILPPVNGADAEIFSKASMVIPRTPAVAQIVSTSSYRAWDMGRSVTAIENMLGFFSSLSEATPKVQMLAKVAHANAAVEQSRREFILWRLQPTTASIDQSSLEDLESDFELATLDAQAMFLECMH